MTDAPTIAVSVVYALPDRYWAADVRVPPEGQAENVTQWTPGRAVARVRQRAPLSSDR